MKRGEVTAFLSLIFLLLISFSASIMEAAGVQMAKNYRRADMNRAVESVFAEFRKELLEEYNVFAFDAGYETGRYSDGQIAERLAYYGSGELEQDVQRIQFLTDNRGRAFYEQAVWYVQHKYGLDFLNQFAGQPSFWKEQEEMAKEYHQEDSKAKEFLEQGLLENEGVLPAENNPLPHIEELKRHSLSDLIMPKGKEISEKEILTDDTVSSRERQQGYGSFEDVAKESTESMLLFGEYLLEHFSSAADVKEGGTLDYEMEYILEGKKSDRQNLEAAMKKLLLLRFVPNYSYILSNAEMRAEAEALALALCTAAALPMLAEAVTQVLLLTWAFGESVMDIRSLLNGNRVPLIKTKESWQLGLRALMTLGTEEDKSEGRDDAAGLSYKEYLRILLFLKKKEDLSMRALDLVELCLRKEKGLAWFRADICVCKLEIESTCQLRHGISYRFRTYYGYK